MALSNTQQLDRNPLTLSQLRRRRRFFLAGLLVAVLLSCDRQSPPIVSYIAAKDQPTTLTWTNPDGWHLHGGDNDLPLATLVPPQGQGAFRVTVSRLSGDAGGMLANVNRWRRQMNLSPVDEEGLAMFIAPAQNQQLDGVIVDMSTPKTTQAEQQRLRTLAALFEYAGQTWFFKVQQAVPIEPVHEQQFHQIVQSVKPGELPVSSAVGESVQGQSAPESGQARSFKVGPVRGIIPAGWQLDPTPRPIRLITFLIGPRPQQAQVAITRFPGDVGGDLANINRWRRQVGLPSIVDLSEQQGADITIAQLPAKAYHFLAPGNEAQRPAILVTGLRRGQLSWFFKMTGPADVIQQQVDPFLRFIRSIEFSKEDSDA